MATIQGVYVALFGRPADPLGLAFFNGVTNNGANLSAISALSSQKEYTDRFAGQNNNTIVNSIYQSLFNRDAEPAGLAFFVDALNKGTLNINNIAIAILDGAQGNDKTVLAAKLASADAFTAALDQPAEVGAYIGTAAANAGRAFLADVTTTAKTAAQADTAVAAVVATGAQGNTITLAINEISKIVVGDAATNSTGKNDIFNATVVGAAATNVDASDAFVFGAAGDSIDGGLGTDTLNLTIDLGGTFDAAQLKSVEILNVSSTVDTGAVTMTNVTGVTQVTAKGGTTPASLTVNDVKLTTTVGVEGNMAAKVATFNFVAADVTGSSDAATLSLKDAVFTTTGKVTIAAIENLTINNSGTSSSAAPLDAVDLKAATITGAGTLTLDLAAAANTKVESVTTSAFTGTFTTDLTNLDAIKTYTGGAGIDKVSIDGAHTNDLAINLGGGNDALVLKAVGTESKTLTVNVGAGLDLVTVENDLGNVQAVDTNANFIKTLITIADFNKAEDSIKVDAGGAANRYTLLVAEQGAVDAATDLLGAATAAAAATAVGKTSVFTWKGDTYIFDNAGGSAALNAGDSLIKITGVTTADLTATNFSVI